MGDFVWKSKSQSEPQHNRLEHDFLDPVRFSSEGQFNLNKIKEIFVTDSFLSLDRDTINCQNIETHGDCKTQGWDIFAQDQTKLNFVTHL